MLTSCSACSRRPAGKRVDACAAAGPGAAARPALQSAGDLRERLGQYPGRVGSCRFFLTPSDQFFVVRPYGGCGCGLLPPRKPPRTGMAGRDVTRGQRSAFAGLAGTPDVREQGGQGPLLVGGAGRWDRSARAVRHAFQERLERTLKSRRALPCPIGVAFFDLDRLST